MNLPAEFIGRVLKTKIRFWDGNLRIPPKVINDFPDAYVDFIYEGQRPIPVLVFESTEDCLAFILKYGKEYV